LEKNIKTKNDMCKTCEIKETPLGKSYWANDGAYTPELDEAWTKLVPSSGEAETLHGELVRAFGRLNYDYGNNGNCNAVETTQDSCDECGGCGYEQDECWTCNGDGKVDEECSECYGSGEVEGDEETEECPTCDGYGKEEVDCHNCDGSGMEEERDCHGCDGDCYVDGEKEIRRDFSMMIAFIGDTFRHYGVNTNTIDSLEEFLVRDDLGYSTYTFSDKEMDVYNKLGDMVGYVITTTENEPREKSGMYK
jgi:hypothetical protein